MKKIIFIIVISFAILNLTSCSKNHPSASHGSIKPFKTAIPKLSEEQQDKITLDEYSRRMINATPNLIKQYIAESASNTSGSSGLYKIAKSKIDKLAKMLKEGQSKLAQTRLIAEDDSPATYNYFSKCLKKIYLSEVEKITSTHVTDTKQ